MDLDFQLDAVKILKCKVCQVETPVNINYPITEVTCQKCWTKQKSDKKWQKCVKPIHAGAWTQLPPCRSNFLRSVQSRPGAGQREPSCSKGFGLLAYLCVMQIRRGGGGICTRNRVRSVPCSVSLNLTQSVATHKPVLSPLINKTYRTERWHWHWSGQGWR